MNVFARFNEITSMTLQDIKETICYGRTDVRYTGRTHNVKTVYPPTNTVQIQQNFPALRIRKTAKQKLSYMCVHILFSRVYFIFHAQMFKNISSKKGSRLVHV